MKRAALAAALLPALLAGCTLLHGHQPQPRPNDPPWGELRDRFTRSTKVYDLLDDRAFATATYQPLALRDAAVDRVAAWRAYSEQQKSAALAQEQAEAAAEEDFLLAFYTGERNDNDLDSPKTIWRVALVVGELEIAPARIELVRVDTTLRTLYPYIGEFDRLYRIRFPAWKGPQPLTENPFTLLVAGAPGRVKLTWKPGEAAPKRY